MSEVTSSARRFAREHSGEIAATLVSAALLGFAGATMGNFWYLFDVDRDATVALALSFAAVGFVAGLVASWVVRTAFPLLRARGVISRLPDGQKAMLGVAIGSAEPLASQGRGDCFRTLASLGLVEEVGDASRMRWSATDLARRAVTRSLMGEVEEATERLREADRAREVARTVEGLLRYDYEDKELLALVAACGSEGCAWPIHGWPEDQSVRRTNDALGRLFREGWCDFTTDGPDTKVWRVTDIVTEACAVHPGLLPKVDD